MMLLFAAIRDTLGSMDPFKSLSCLENSLVYIPIGNRLAQAPESSLNLCVSCLPALLASLTSPSTWVFDISSNKILLDFDPLGPLLKIKCIESSQNS